MSDPNLTRWADGGVTIRTEHPEHKHTREVSVRSSNVGGAIANVSVAGWNGDRHLGAGENLNVEQVCEVIAALSRLVERAFAEQAAREREQGTGGLRIVEGGSA